MVSHLTWVYGLLTLSLPKTNFMKPRKVLGLEWCVTTQINLNEFFRTNGSVVHVFWGVSFMFHLNRDMVVNGLILICLCMEAYHNVCAELPGFN